MHPAKIAVFGVSIGLIVVNAIVLGSVLRPIVKHVKQPPSYIDRTPPSCFMEPTKDKQYLCEWKRVPQPPTQAIWQKDGGKTFDNSRPRG